MSIPVTSSRPSGRAGHACQRWAAPINTAMPGHEPTPARRARCWPFLPIRDALAVRVAPAGHLASAEATGRENRIVSEFEGKVALVTGGASGIGAATVRALASRGTAVVIADLAADAGEALAAELRAADLAAEFAQLDATSEPQIAALMTHIGDRHGRLDFAHNNVGLGETGVTIETTTLERWDWTLDLSLKSTWLCMKYEIPLMRAGGGGSIINTASMAGVRVSFTASPAYSAAKAAVIHLTAYAAAAYAKENIRVNCISPGLTATPQIASMLSPELQREIAAELQLIDRAVTPEEIAAAVIFLCSKGGAMLTGENLKVCGGQC
jgi:NAD(P)-dependent dehydrogenase (short-subunit alcohol dehydrogenase family)